MLEKETDKKMGNGDKHLIAHLKEFERLENIFIQSKKTK